MSTWRSLLAAQPNLPHETTLQRRTLHDGFLRLRADEVRLPSGRAGQREVVEHRGSAFMIPLTEDDHILMVRQYRYAVGEYLLELPAGVVDPGESPVEAARRELIEEVGHEPASVRQLAEVFITPGYCTEVGTLWLCEGCRPVAGAVDADEPLSVLRNPRGEIAQMLTAPERPIRNGMTLSGLLWLVNGAALGG